MQNQHALTRNFSLPQAKRFFACWDRQNDLFRRHEKIYGSEKRRFEIASGGASLSSMNGYASKTRVFLFCKRMALVKKNGLMLLGKFMVQDHWMVKYHKLAPRALSCDSQEFI
jgi:hypothetical protein